jgi:hypothetical protein
MDTSSNTLQTTQQEILNMFTVKYSMDAQRHWSEWTREEYETFEEASQVAISLLADGFYVQITE